MPPQKRNPAIEVQVRHFQSQHILQYIASLRACMPYAYAYVHAHTHTDRQECSVEWKIALGTTRPCYAAFSFFSARARMFFSRKLCWGYAR